MLQEEFFEEFFATIWSEEFFESERHRSNLWLV
jgi:hypothetical protein